MRLIAILLLTVGIHAAETSCVLDQAFVGRALVTWEGVRTEALQIPDAARPNFIFFNNNCVWRDGKGSPHNGTITLPDGNEIPVGIMTFASTHEGKPFLVMALPEVWRTDPRHRENPRLEMLIRGVFVHEMTHTRQAGSLGARVSELEAQHKLEDLNDDIVQTRFASRDGFTAAYEKERDLLFAIANESDAKQRSKLAADVLRAIRDRRARYFTGDDAYYAELEQLFFDMEGVAQWAGFRAAMREGLSRDEALSLMRGSRKWFSQEEGLALFLAIDATTPGWQKRVFRDAPESATRLLESR